MKLFIIIVSYNPGLGFAKLLRDLSAEKLKDGVLKIVVVDNGSNENIKRVPSGRRSNIKLIRNKRNFGFASGCNIGIRYALENGADRVLLLNQDVIIERGFIGKLFANPADIVSPVIKFMRRNDWVYDYGGKVNWQIGRTTHMELANYPISQLSNKPIDYVSGCAMLIKREVFDKIGLFDEKFFMYFEDADFCIRAKRAGFRIGVESKSMIVHHLVEGKDRSDFKKHQLLRSNAIFINKYLGFYRLVGYFYLLFLAGKMML